jgi:hypothetical protein
MQFGKRSGDEFVLDFAWPLCALQAFSLGARAARVGWVGGVLGGGGNILGAGACAFAAATLLALTY